MRTHVGSLWSLNKDGSGRVWAEGVPVLQGLTATAGLYEKALERLADQDIPKWDGPAAVAAMREAGVWLEIGGVGWRHLHFLCGDRSRTEFGQVYDVNDGDPSTGLVPDRETRQRHPRPHSRVSRGIRPGVTTLTGRQGRR
ncbi:hypothetical protein V6V16_04090 [Micromonospora sp. CPCC 205561]